MCPGMAQLDGGGSACNVTLTAPALMAAPVFMYYQVDNFFQNHRRCAAACLTSVTTPASRPLACSAEKRMHLPSVASDAYATALFQRQSMPQL